MRNSKKKYEKQEKIRKTILNLWDSLESHVIYIYLPHEDGKEFHRKTALSYLKSIKDLLEVL